MKDFTLLSVRWMLDLRVSTYDSQGVELPDTGAYQRHCAETVFVFAEFMKARGLLRAGVDVTRRDDLELQFSDLTEGQRFTRFALDKWMRSVDRAGIAKPVTPKGLERLLKNSKRRACNRHAPSLLRASALRMATSP